MENPFEIIADTHEEMTGEKFEYTKKIENENAWYDSEKAKSYKLLSMVLKRAKIDDKKLSLDTFEELSKWILDTLKKLDDELTSLKEENKRTDKILKNTYEYIRSIGKTKDMRAFRRGKGGRKEIKIDWEKYDRLRAEGATQQQTADIMKVGVSTLRRKLKERKNNNE